MGADFDVSIFEKKEQPRSTFEKPEYLTLSVGQHTTRVLATPHKVFIHYIPDRKLTIACPGEDCPICKTNKRLMVEFPHDYNKQKGFMSRQTRFLMNVLDRTQVKVCPGCGAEVKRGADGKFSPMCYKCNVMVAEVPVTKSNKVKILGISQSNADVLFALHNSTLDDNNDIIGLNNFDVNWLVTKSANGKTAITPMASTNRDILDGEYKLWDLETATIRLTAQELGDLVNGAQLRDIFLSRREEKQSDLPKVEKVSKEVESDIQDAISDLFGS